MKFNKKKAAAVALTSVFFCGALAGCDLVTSDTQKNLLQVIAEVDITNGEDFQTGGEYEQYSNVISKAEILKRDMVASYVSVGYQYVSSYGYTYQQTYDLIMSSLVNRQIYLQYATVYFLSGDNDYTVEGYNAATADITDATEKQIAGLGYFLDEDEIKQAEYSVKVTFNTTIDAQEPDFIDEESDDTEYDTARTTPTGVDTEKDDYYDEAYQIYIGSNSASACGSYETLDGSTPTTRRKAYGQFLARLNTFALINKGEDTTNVTGLSYYRLELKNAYEDALISKLSEAFEDEAETAITREWVEEKFSNTLTTQKTSFSDTTTLESALDSVSDSSFVLYSPDINDNNYGFVINILLPFSTTQSTLLETALADYGDKLGNYFGERAKLLQNVKATDQRKTWFTCEDDYSFLAADEDNAFTNGNSDRTYLFFENNLKNTDRYETIPNYYGKYTYNGTVSKDSDGDYVIKPNSVTIDGFIDEMKSYLSFAGYSVEQEKNYNENGDYYSKGVGDYYTNGEVDYSSFLYYYGQVAKGGETLSSSFNANNVFKAGSTENEVMSVINELSFAYNTDTAGLNTYLGYVVSPESTSFVKEFEYAAQLAVQGGVGTIVVAPSDYGWHIIYCTFSYTGNEMPYEFDWDEIETEGTFSYLYYEALKSSNLEAYATDRQTRIINSFDNDTCVTKYEKRYADLIAAGDEE